MYLIIEIDIGMKCKNRYIIFAKLSSLIIEFDVWIIAVYESFVETM